MALKAIETAKQLIDRLFPQCEATRTSDLDIIIIDNNIMSSKGFHLLAAW